MCALCLPGSSTGSGELESTIAQFSNSKRKLKGANYRMVLSVVHWFGGHHKSDAVAVSRDDEAYISSLDP